MGDLAARITPDDMKRLIKDSNPFTGARMRMLFFPVLTDLRWSGARGQVRGDIYRIDTDWLRRHPNMQPPWPRLAEPYRIDAGQVFPYRRPEFLAALSDDEYIGLFRRLLSESVFDKPFPPWQQVMGHDSRKAAPTAHAILTHVLHWVNPSYHLPSTKSANAATWDWDLVIASEVMPHRSLAQVTKPAPGQPRDDRSSARALVDDVLAYTRTYYADLNTTELRPLVRELSSLSPFHDFYKSM
ncbi:hypothetical protein VTN02DRAFT_2266 [Thermoascus thermophilus]